MVLHVRIDNLPPDKSWSQVRQLVGSIVHSLAGAASEDAATDVLYGATFPADKELCGDSEGKHRPDDAAELADGHKQLPMGLL